MTPDVPKLFANVLCAIDYSESARRALAQAMQLTRCHDARLTVMHVLPSYTIALTGLPHERAMQEARRRAATEMVACGVSLDGNLTAPEVVIDIGDPATLITETAKKIGANLLVLGTHGASGIDRLMMGSIAEKVLRTSPCPVLTVPPHAPAPRVSAFERILCPIDFSGCSLAAYGLAKAIASKTGGSIALMHAIEWPWVEPPAPLLGELPAEQAVALSEYRRYVTTEAVAALKRVAQPSGPDDVVATTTIVHGRAALEIVKAEVELNADLIVMGVHGRSVLDMALFGSVTHRVLLGARCPVLTICG